MLKGEKQNEFRHDLIQLEFELFFEFWYFGEPGIKKTKQAKKYASSRLECFIWTFNFELENCSLFQFLFNKEEGFLRGRACASSFVK